MKKLKLEDWITIQRRRKWKWAQRLASKDYSDWTVCALNWDPTREPSLDARRRKGRPKTRWTDDIAKYVLSAVTNTGNPNTDLQQSNPNHEAWLDIPRDPSLWDTLEDGFVRRLTS